MRATSAAVMVAILLVVTPAQAIFHAALIDEVRSGSGTDPNVQFVEIRMLSGFQNAVAMTRLTWFNCNFTSCQVLLLVPGNVPNEGANVRWLMASPNDTTFFAATGVHADFYWDPAVSGGIDPTCGMVCWGGGAPGIVPLDPASWNPGDPNQYVDCVAYGAYSGPTKTSTHDGTPTSGTPTPLTPGNGTQSLTRSTNTGNNAADFALATPTPTNNGGPAGGAPGGPFGSCTPVGASGTTTTTTFATSTTRPRGTTTTTTLPSGVGLPISGKRLVLKDEADNPAKRRLLVLSRDGGINLGGGNGSTDDPTLNGGSLRVRTTAGCGTGGAQGCDDSYPLPATRWRRIGKPGKSKGYVYRDRSLTNGPVRAATAKVGRTRLLMAKGRGAGLGHALGADPRPVDVVLQTGTKRYCMRFGGTVTTKTGKRYTFTGAPAPAACAP